jgi:hypothetical protein
MKAMMRWPWVCQRKYVKERRDEGGGRREEGGGRREEGGHIGIRSSSLCALMVIHV